jgi:hypothetical protein
MSDLCEACCIRPIETAYEYDEESSPYRLCGPCYHRLQNRALRPLEYFNLASIHGACYELHDDFYDDDGKACAAEISVEQDASLAFPTLKRLHDDVHRLVDYTIVKFWYPQEVTPYLAKFTPSQVLEVLDEKLVLNHHLLPTCLEIAAEVLGPQAHAWVRYQLAQFEDPNKAIFAHALAHCLPKNEGELIILETLSSLNERDLREHITCLRYFSGDGPLDWLEEQRGRINTVSGNYGSVCACLSITWPRVHHWLNLGRPLSLIALDALVECSTTAESINRALWLREHPPHLHEPASINEMNKALDEYLRHDSVPRTKNAVSFIQQHWREILKAED